MKKWILILSLGVNFLYGQKVVVNKVDDNRSSNEESYFSRCEVELKVSGEDIRKYKQLKLASLTKVVDDRGIDLIKEDEMHSDYVDIGEIGLVTVKLRNPSRKAITIKELSGQINLYNPTVANGAIIKVPGYTKKANENLLSSKIPLKLIYVDKASLEKYAKEQKAKNEVELAKLSEADRKLTETLLSLADAFSNYGDENSITLFATGDKSILVDVYFEEGGKKIDGNGRMESGETLTYYFNQKPKPSWTMVLEIESATSVKKLPFKLTNIELP